MIYALVITVTALAVLCHILWHLALTLLAAEQLVAELRRGQQLDAETMRLKDQRISTLEKAIDQHQERVAYLVGCDTALERRNQLLEWALARHINRLPKADKARAVAIRSEISLN